MIDHNELYKSFVNIPFLDLGPIDNFNEIYEESMATYESNQLLTMNSLNPVDNTYLNLQVEGVFDYKGFPEIGAHCDSCLPSHKVQNKLHVPFKTAELTKPTQFSKKIPATTEYIKSILDYPGRIRFSVLKANTSVGWHSHYVNDLTEVTLHMSIKTNPKVLAEVGYCDFTKLKVAEDWFATPSKIYSKHFSQGRLWLLNSKHFHRFVNPSNEDRIHIWISTYFYDDKGFAVNKQMAERIHDAICAYNEELVTQVL